ncbi:MAG: hypothetical protein AMJ88_08070 [Anaerolineae bacterium SM23_ 63]|nr:MAG: hypothetical protein AMJ88_08070 [Anaerolineae bacterium SM23_ 63]HEY46915.1 hypothetical protein [Anaerolineae bacterium]
MSEPRKVFRRPSTEGWIVLSGLVPSLNSEMPQLAEHFLPRLDLSRLPFCLSGDIAIGEDLQSFLEDIEILLDSPVTVIRIHELTGNTFHEIIESANMLVMAGGDVHTWIDVFDPVKSEIDVDDMLGEGRLVFTVGPASSALGSWFFSGDEGPAVGLGWLIGAIVLPDVENPGDIPSVKDFLSQHKLSYALGLPRGAVLALGPRGEIEVWSITSPSIALGIAWGEQ